jgi:hypothetical protein
VAGSVVLLGSGVGDGVALGVGVGSALGLGVVVGVLVGVARGVVGLLDGGYSASQAIPSPSRSRSGR